MNNNIKLLINLLEENWFLWVPIALLLIYWLIIVLFKTIRVKWLEKLISIVFNGIPLLIALSQIFPLARETQLSETESLILFFYYFVVTFLQYVMYRYKKLLPETKLAYKFNKQYTGIQKQWNSIEDKKVDTKVKSGFIEGCLHSIESTIAHTMVQENPISDNRIKGFVETVGSVSGDYILLCSNKNVIYNKIFAWLYKYLFEEYKISVLSPIHSTTIGTANLIIPEFVSNGLTQAVIKNEKNVQYQHNTSVVRTLSEFENNVEAGTELKGKIKEIKRSKKNFLQRIIINNSFKDSDQQDIVEKIIKWHENSNVDLRFISATTAEEIKNHYSTVERLDFSVIKMVDESEYFILGADKLPHNSYFAGQWHEMYAVKCASYSEEPENNKLFDELWEKAETANLEYASGVLSKITFNTTCKS